MFGRWDVVAVYGGGSVQKVCWHTVEKKVRPSAKQNVCGFDIYYVSHQRMMFDNQETIDNSERRS
jgi:hypothetical protein